MTVRVLDLKAAREEMERARRGPRLRHGARGYQGHTDRATRLPRGLLSPRHGDVDRGGERASSAVDRPSSSRTRTSARHREVDSPPSRSPVPESASGRIEKLIFF